MSSSDERPRSQASYPPSPPRDTSERPDQKWLERLRTRFGFKSSGSIRHDLEEVLGEDEKQPSGNGFTPAERSMLRNILDLRELRVDDLMVPRADVVAVQQDVALGHVIQVFEEAGHTRLVVFDDTLDDPVGMVHIKDIIGFLLSESKKTKGRRKVKDQPAQPMNFATVDLERPLIATKLVRPILFVPPSMPAMDLLGRMQTARSPMALVIDEYGGTDGLVTVKDIVTSIVGEIEDEHEEDDGPVLKAVGDGVFLVDARASLEEVSEALGEQFVLDEDITDEIDTVGGLLISLCGHVPVRGQVVPGPGDYEFEVVDADPRRIKRVKIHPRKFEVAPLGPAKQKTPEDAAPVDSAAEALSSTAAQDQKRPTDSAA